MNSVGISNFAFLSAYQIIRPTARMLAAGWLATTLWASISAGRTLAEAFYRNPITHVG